MAGRTAAPSRNVSLPFGHRTLVVLSKGRFCTNIIGTAGTIMSGVRSQGVDLVSSGFVNGHVLPHACKRMIVYATGTQFVVCKVARKRELVKIADTQIGMNSIGKQVSECNCYVLMHLLERSRST